MALSLRVVGCLVACVALLAACNPDGYVDTAVSVSGGTERIRVTGWAWDPNAAGTPVTVKVVVDGVVRGSASANRFRPDVAEVYPAAGTKTGFDITVGSTAGTHRVCVIAVNIAGTEGEDVVLDPCRTVSVAASKLPKINWLTVAGTSGAAPHTVLLNWSVSTPSSSSPTCRVNWDGGAFDETIGNCDNLRLRSHTYLTSGTRTITLEVSDGVHPPVTVRRSVSVTSASEESFDITYRTTGLDAAYDAAVADGVARWESVIPVGIPSVPLSTDAGDCGPESPAVNETVDDLFVDIVVATIDGPEGILAVAGPCLIRTSNGLPAYGAVIIDGEDIGAVSVADVVAHELGHVLGIGVLWDGSVVSQGTSNPRYRGAYGWSRSTDTFGPAVENVGGPGSAGSHWRESVYGDELMTSEADGVNVLSSISIGALADLGYRVDFNAAEPHPGTALRQDDGHDHFEEILITPHGEV